MRYIPNYNLIQYQNRLWIGIGFDNCDFMYIGTIIKEIRSYP